MSFGVWLTGLLAYVDVVAVICVCVFLLLLSVHFPSCTNAIYPLLLLLPQLLLSSLIDVDIDIVHRVSSLSYSYVVFGLSVVRFVAVVVCSLLYIIYLSKLKQFHFVFSLSIIVCFSVAVR